MSYWDDLNPFKRGRVLPRAPSSPSFKLGTPVPEFFLNNTHEVRCLDEETFRQIIATDLGHKMLSNTILADLDRVATKDLWPHRLESTIQDWLLDNCRGFYLTGPNVWPSHQRIFRFEKAEDASDFVKRFAVSTT